MYIAIDIETTGLNPEYCQVLEIGAVADVQEDVLMACPTFRTLIEHPTVIGEPYALALNKGLLEEIAARALAPCPATAMDRFRNWLCKFATRDNKATLVGKNVGSFDLQFLNRLPGWPKELLQHRILDVGSMHATREGIPSQSQLCKDTAEAYHIPGEEHTALYDALVSLALARVKWGLA